jgi:succinoglycan biosynthesis protein ExoV
VRGPRTARALGLDERLAITDAAILVRAVDGLVGSVGKRHAVSFMPHWESAQFGSWHEVSDLAGIHFIDPRAPVETILDDLLATEVLVTEAMHGAIVADALRVPWIPILPSVPAHRFKWLDWCESLGIDCEPHVAGTSTVREFVRAKGLDSFYPAELVKRVTGRHGGGLDRFLRQHAAKRLREIAKRPPLLSTEARCASATDQAVEKLEALRSDFRHHQRQRVPA